MSNPEIHERRFIKKGSMLIHEGEQGSGAFLIQSGEVRVFAAHGDREVELAHLGPGQIVGEMALLFEEKRTASVQALEDTTVILITRMVLEEKLRKSDPTVRAIVPMLMNRIVQNNNTLLNRNADIRTLMDAVRNIYDTINESLPASQQISFRNSVLPKLDQLLAAMKAFVEKYTEK